MSEAVELLPCPFCGSKNVKLFSLDEDCEVVSCDDCNGQGGYFLAPDSTGPEEAIAAWNTRAASAALVAEAEARGMERAAQIAENIYYPWEQGEHLSQMMASDATALAVAAAIRAAAGVKP